MLVQWEVTLTLSVKNESVGLLLPQQTLVTVAMETVTDLSGELNIILTFCLSSILLQIKLLCLYLSSSFTVCDSLRKAPKSRKLN